MVWMTESAGFQTRLRSKSNMRFAGNLVFVTVIFFSIFAGASPSALATPKTCESLAQLSLPNTNITVALSVTTGEFTPAGRQASIKELPPFCRVAATLKPSADSDIKVEVWLPLNGWNGIYRGQGNGGFAGTINFDAMADAIKLGYATAST